MCCNGPSWKREVVPDHKFDFIDTREFHSKSFGIRLRYLWLYILVVKSFLVYVSDIFTAVTMLSTRSWQNRIFQKCPTDKTCFIIPFNIGKWLFVGCIIFSFLLLAYETHKAKKIIASRDISYAFSNVMANNYYSLRSYDHFCFFCHISNSTKKKDDFAFFIFFTFKSWKRVLFADGPRQTINALTLYSFYIASNSNDPRPFYDLSKYSDNFITTGLIITTLFTVLLFAGSLLLLLAAGVCYIPLLCYIQGNLKEYCCHKVDKRIAELMKKKNKQRLAKAAALARKEAAGDFSHLKNKKGELIAKPLPQPTLPKVNLDDLEETDSMSMRTKVDPEYQYWQQDKQSEYKGYPPYNNDLPAAAPDYPPMPVYQQQPSYQSDNSGTVYDAGGYYYDDGYAASQITLTQAAAPIAGYRESDNFYPNPHSAAQNYFPDYTTGPARVGQGSEQHDSRFHGLPYDHDYSPSVVSQQSYPNTQQRR